MPVIFLILVIFCSITFASGNAKCGNCLNIRDQAAQARAESIKATILKKLDLNSPPNISQISAQPKTKPALEKLARYVEQEMRHDSVLKNNGEAKSKDKTTVFGQEIPTRINGKRAINFRFSKDLKAKHVVSGVLTVQLRQPAAAGPNAKVEPLESVVNEIDTSNKAVPIAHYKHSYESIPEHEKVFVEKKDLERWIGDGSVTINVEVKSGTEDLVNYPSTDDPYTVFLEVVGVNPKLRQKRDAEYGVCDSDINVKACCRYDFVIDFHKAGWDFVHFPSIYNAFICLGECNRRNRNGHDLLSSSDNRTTAGCCHPGQYEDLEIAYFTDDGTLKRTTIPDMVAKTCVCE